METANIIIADKVHLQSLLDERSDKPYYTYILRRPDGVQCFGGVGTPFYCGIGKGNRIFSHLIEVKKGKRESRKAAVIASILEAGGEVIHCIDGFFAKPPWDREEELIRSIGQLKHGTGPLTNEQDYAPSFKIGSVEIRKYTDVHVDDAESIPQTFKLRHVRLMAGPVEPRSRSSVFGKIYTVLEAHPGVTGEELVGLLRRVDFTENRSAYTQSGQVCAAWLCGYIEGGFFRKDRRHLQAYVGSSDDF